MSFIKPAAEKLPLAVRKDVRDNFEAEKQELLDKLTGLLGRPYTVTFDPNELFPYTEVDGFAKKLKGYLAGFIRSMTAFTEKYSTEGVQHFNDAVHKSEIGMHVNPKGDGGNVIDCEIVDGVLNILFKYDCFGYNQTQLSDYIDIRVSEVPREGDLPLLAKHSVIADYDPEIERVRSEIADALAMPDVVLDPNFMEVYQQLKASDSSLSSDWESKFGNMIFRYFKQGLLGNVNSLGFPKDDMLQEGLAEVLTSKTFKLRIVEKLIGNGQNDTVFEDGVCYLQTTASSWTYNMSEMGRELVSLL